MLPLSALNGHARLTGQGGFARVGESMIFRSGFSAARGVRPLLGRGRDLGPSQVKRLPPGLHDKVTVLAVSTACSVVRLSSASV